MKRVEQRYEWILSKYNPMENYIIYQTKHSIWFIPTDKWNEYVYHKELKPIRMAIVEMTDECASLLYELFKSKKREFVKILKDELNETFSLYMN